MGQVLKNVASSGTLGAISAGLKAAAQSLNRLSSQLKKVGGEFTRYVTAPFLALAALSLKDKIGDELRALGTLAKETGDNFAEFLLPAVRSAIGFIQNL